MALDGPLRPRAQAANPADDPSSVCAYRLAIRWRRGGRDRQMGGRAFHSCKYRRCPVTIGGAGCDIRIEVESAGNRRGVNHHKSPAQVGAWYTLLVSDGFPLALALELAAQLNFTTYRARTGKAESAMVRARAAWIRFMVNLSLPAGSGGDSAASGLRTIPRVGRTRGNQRCGRRWTF